MTSQTVLVVVVFVILVGGFVLMSVATPLVPLFIMYRKWREGEQVSSSRREELRQWVASGQPVVLETCPLLFPLANETLRFPATVEWMRAGSESEERLHVPRELRPGHDARELVCPDCGAPLPAIAATQAVVCRYCEVELPPQGAAGGGSAAQTVRVTSVALSLLIYADGQTPMRLSAEMPVQARDLAWVQAGACLTLVVQSAALSKLVDGEETEPQQPALTAAAVEVVGFVDPARAVPARATVEHCVPGHRFMQQEAQWLEVRVSVPVAGGAPFASAIRGFFPLATLPSFAPGEEIDVVYDRADPRQIRVQWDTSYLERLALGQVFGVGGLGAAGT